MFAVLLLAASIGVLASWSLTDLSGEQAYRHMIRVSVRCSVPWLVLAFVASATARLWPGPRSAWLLRNRKYIGLAFSASMLWQILFIALLIAAGGRIFSPGLGKYFIISDLIGYALLLAMTVTSFDAVRRRMARSWWRRLHRTGIYYIWFIYTYSFFLGAYFLRVRAPDESFGYLVLAICMLGAAALRFAAWRDRRAPAITTRAAA